ncbi:MAG TPA: aldehyde dehydrogenase, partial [Deltaproteobacteria bacterium]|nr:aldehyde dehydrogenase [Deltaproteobacteria bacterium]
ISLISPTGALGMGFLDQSLERGISLKPDVIACDAGSTDSGPFYLGSGTPKMTGIS